MRLQTMWKTIMRKTTKNKQSFDKKRAVYRLSAFVFGFLMKRLYAFVSCSGSLGLTHTVRLLVKMTMPGLAPAGFFDVFDRNVNDRHVFRAARLAVIGGDGGCLKDGCFVRLDAAALHDDVGTG